MSRNPKWKNQHNYKDRMQAKGFKQVRVWVRPEDVSKVHELAEQSRAEATEAKGSSQPE